MAVIEVSNLKKYYQVFQKEPGLAGSIKSLFKRKYETVKAVDDVSFSIDAGELVGFIGPNGAGKTTTLKVLSGLLYPTAGQVSVLGYTPFDRKPAFQKQFSLVMGQKNQLWWDLPALDSFLLNKEIYEVPRVQFDQTFADLVTMLDLTKVIKVQVRKLSLGQRMKCELVAALLHQPKVLFLDEPTIGLDVVMQQKIREFIKDYNQKYQATIILTSHYMDDVKELCDRVIIIDKGKIFFDGKLSEIIKKYADRKTLEVVFDRPMEKKNFATIRAAKIKTFTPKRTVFTVKREKVNQIAAELLKSFPVVDLNITESSIEDIIREVFTGRDFS
ncbi:ABC transporter [Candidatus Beckwithbacteria bacterium CG22_combo_CG10-13_8_21_14_all_01_47_9]|uniref:ABC transporter n=2 Tax=Candidatus Beckwithiibacteriota TaxID=1752726 RepID=A0A2H0E396_9BACT|nr:MAG: ABC transporter [Candidatus Beckwithbacteria bacterium CG1_02_47_37]PIP88290.1 MAG: ABC transporter [Candidatus Beckwithbacteria bacterium CG22_combo_CG10-13_8_21_14_all_01_47_9]